MKKNITLLNLMLLSVNAIFANTYIVTTTSDSGAGSIRQAIIDANNNIGADSIVFNIPGIAPHTIIPTTSLPIITNDSTIIDGSTQPANGYTGISPKIILDGTQAPPSGSSYQPAIGFDVSSSYFELYGVYITKFQGSGIVIDGSYFKIGAAGKGNVISGNADINFSQVELVGFFGVIENNKIGTDITGLIDPDVVYAGGILAHYVSSLLIKDNVISGNSGGNAIGFVSLNCSMVTIVGNKIGVGIDGITSVPNGGGIDISGSNFVVGGYNSGEGNIISSNQTSGIFANGCHNISIIGNNISGSEWSGIHLYVASNVIIKANKIGLHPDGITPYGNGRSGISLSYTDSCMIGGANIGDGNIIAYNGRWGVDFSNYSRYNKISRNSIYCNGDSDNYEGIGFDSVADYIPPIILTLTNSSLSGTAQANDIVEIFGSDTCGTCQGKTFIASVIADSLGNWSYTGSISGNITTTATSTITNNNTSPFSICTNSINVNIEQDIINKNMSFSLYPNPINNQAKLEYTLTQNEVLSAELIDMNGKLIKSFFTNEKKSAGVHTQTIILEESIKTGNYLLVLKNSTQHIPIKITKQ